MLLQTRRVTLLPRPSPTRPYPLHLHTYIYIYTYNILYIFTLYDYTRQPYRCFTKSKRIEIENGNKIWTQLIHFLLLAESVFLLIFPFLFSLFFQYFQYCFGTIRLSGILSQIMFLATARRRRIACWGHKIREIKDEYNPIFFVMYF